MDWYVVLQFWSTVIGYMYFMSVSKTYTPVHIVLFSVIALPDTGNFSISSWFVSSTLNESKHNLFKHVGKWKIHSWGRCTNTQSDWPAFPGYFHAQTKYWNEMGEPSKIYHVSLRNVTGRENLSTCGWMNELAHAILTECTWSVVKAYCQQNGTRQHYATLSGSMTSYGKCTQTHTLENHANLLAYLADWLLHIPENGFQGGPFPSFA